MEIAKKNHKVQGKKIYFSILTIILVILFFIFIYNFNMMQYAALSELSAHSKTIISVIKSGKKVFSQTQNFIVKNQEFFVFLDNLIKKDEICFIAVFDDYGKLKFTRESDKCKGASAFAIQYIAKNEKSGKIVEWKGRPIYLEFKSKYEEMFSESDLKKKLVRNVPWNYPGETIVVVGLGAQIYQHAMGRDNLFLIMASFLALSSSALWLAVVKWRRQASKFESIAREKSYMNSLATLAGGMAHEVRNPLGTIKGIGVYFSAKFEIGSRERALLNEMDGDIDRLNKIISEFLELTSSLDLRFSSTSGSEILLYSLEMTHSNIIKKSIFVDKLLCNDDYIVLDKRRMIFSIIIFIIKTIQFIPNKGILKISCLSIGDRLEFHFSNASSIKEKHCSNIFIDLLFMNNNNACADFRIARSIVLAHGGQIRVESEVDHGIKYIIELPRYR